MEAWVRAGLLYGIVAVEAIAVLLIFYAALEALWATLKLVFGRRESAMTLQTVRMRLGRWLSLALEFALAADVVATAIAPTWEDIGKLAAIIVLRTFLNYFLQREMREAEVEEQHLLPTRKT